MQELGNEWSSEKELHIKGVKWQLLKSIQHFEKSHPAIFKPFMQRP